MDETEEMQFDNWVQDYGDAIFRICLNYLDHQYALAEDATQDTFLKAWKSMHAFRRKDGCSPKTWLIAIAINTCKDIKRSAWRRSVVLTPDAAVFAPQGKCCEHEDSFAIFQAVSQLPTKLRVPLMLYYHQNLTYTEIAKVLKISVSTVHSRLKRAYEELEQAIKEGD